MEQISKISKSALARELTVSPARISQLLTAGLPTLPGGQLDRLVALRWIRANCGSDRGGWRVRGRDIVAAAQAALERAESELDGVAQDQRAILLKIIQAIALLPEVLHSVGAEPVAVLVCCNAWDSF